MGPGGLCRKIRSSGGTTVVQTRAGIGARTITGGRRCGATGSGHFSGTSFRQGTRMHTTARTTVRVGTWVAVLAVLAAGIPVGRAAQDAKAPAVSPDKKY